MNKTTLKRTAICSALLSAVVMVAGCNDDDNSSSNNSGQQQTTTEKLTGTVATGAALAGANVEVVNKNGTTKSVVAGADGKFSIDVEKGAPYLLKATKGTGESQVTLYSYASAAGNVNVTQLTTQALFDVNGQMDVAKLWEAWQSQAAGITQAKIDESAKKVAANLNEQFTKAGVDPKKVNIFNYEFKPDGKGFDAVLDQVKIDYSCNIGSCNVTYKVGDNANYNWNYTISTNGYSFVVDGGGNGAAGSGQNCAVDMDYSYNFNGISGSAVYKICYINFPQNASCAAGNGTLSNLLNTVQVPGVSGTMKVNKFVYQSVASCPAGSIEIAYKQ